MTDLYQTFELVDGLKFEDLKTVDDCDEALGALAVAIIMIEDQLLQARHEAHEGKAPDKDWERRAQMALKFKKAARQQVQALRGKIRHAEVKAQNDDEHRRLIEIFKARFPEQFKETVRIFHGGVNAS